MELYVSMYFVLSLILVLQSTCYGYVNLVQERGLRWCHNFCLCTQTSEEPIHCMQAQDIYSILNFNEVQIRRLTNANWNPVSHLKWCSVGRCFCNRKTDKTFACIEVPDYLATFVNRTAESIAPSQERRLNLAGVGGYDENQETTHRKREMDDERRNKRRNRNKNRRNKKRLRPDGSEDLNALSYDDNYSQEEYEQNDGVDRSADEFNLSNNLPKQEAINSNPMVTAMQPPTRKQPNPPPTTPPTPFNESSPHPNMQEVSHGNFKPEASERVNSWPEYEVPLQRKTVVGRVSDDLKQITEDVQHIRNDVIFNQRVLLVTAGIAAVAMLGVVVLTLYACCASKPSRRSKKSTNGGNDKHGHHPSSTATKVNIDEAW